MAFCNRQPVLTLPVAVLGEQGLIGIAIDPDFEQNHAIWVSYTLPESENNGLKANQIVRFSEQNNVATDVTTVLTLPNETESDRHNIGNIAFGNDGKLYVSVGDDNLSRNRTISWRSTRQDIALRSNRAAQRSGRQSLSRRRRAELRSDLCLRSAQFV